LNRKICPIKLPDTKSRTKENGFYKRGWNMRQFLNAFCWQLPSASWGNDDGSKTKENCSRKLRKSLFAPWTQLKMVQEKVNCCQHAISVLFDDKVEKCQENQLSFMDRVSCKQSLNKVIVCTVLGIFKLYRLQQYKNSYFTFKTKKKSI
jgi:hypothetical protein